MNNLTKALMEELTVEYVKVGPLQIPESVVISWAVSYTHLDVYKSQPLSSASMGPAAAA